MEEDETATLCDTLTAEISVENDVLDKIQREELKRLLRPFLVDYICTYAYRGSVDNFNRTWTSSTEYSAMQLIEMENKYSNSDLLY